MKIWAISKDGKPLTVKKIRKFERLFALDINDDEFVTGTSKKSIAEWIENWGLKGTLEPMLIWSKKGV